MNLKNLTFIALCMFSTASINIHAMSKFTLCAASATATGFGALKLSWNAYKTYCTQQKQKPSTADFFHFTKNEITKAHRFLANPKNLNLTKELGAQQKLLTALIATTELLACSAAVTGCVKMCIKFKESSDLKKMLLETETKLSAQTALTKEQTTLVEQKTTELKKISTELTDIQTVRHQLETNAQKDIAALKAQLTEVENKLQASLQQQGTQTSPSPTRTISPDREELKATNASLKAILAKTRAVLMQEIEEYKERETNIQQEYTMLLTDAQEQSRITLEEETSKIRIEFEEIMKRMHTNALAVVEEKETTIENYETLFKKQCTDIRGLTERIDNEIRKYKALEKQNNDFAENEIGLNYQILELKAQIQELEMLNTLKNHLNRARSSKARSLSQNRGTTLSPMTASPSPQRTESERETSPEPTPGNSRNSSVGTAPIYDSLKKI